ncbi:MAG: hypothetical protein PHH49_03315 [Candidatus Omnitrophica bacterium]|nr:hypothetical protein [Candidatus Omnitrophota bacterium]MDD5487977.1 hypothetical protein [Candidatus Omnitrophota bacterium]
MNANTTRKIFAAIGVVVLVAGIGALTCSAESAKKSLKEKAKDAGRATINYPANVVKESADIVGSAAKGTVNTVGNTLNATGQTLTGDVDKAKDIVVAPVEGTVETVKDATVSTVEMPVTAAKTTAEQNN